MPVKAILFDWDGVLADSRLSAYACSVKIFETYGLISPSLETYLAEVGSDYMAYYQKYGVPKAVAKETLNAVWLSYFHNPSIQNEANTPLRKGVPETLARLREKNIRMSIVSGNITSFIEQMTTHHHIREFFTEVHADIGGTKTERIKHAAEKLGALPAETLFIDDTAAVISHGHAAGVRTVAITGGFTSEEALRAVHPTHLIHEIPDLLTLV